MTFSVVDQLIKIVMIFFQAKLIWVGAGSGLREGSRLTVTSKLSIIIYS